LNILLDIVNFERLSPGYDHTTLLINNIGRGPSRDENVIEDYNDVENDAGRAWFLPHHGNTEFTGGP
jgi:hypothetical protein